MSNCCKMTRVTAVSNVFKWTKIEKYHINGPKSQQHNTLQLNIIKKAPNSLLFQRNKNIFTQMFTLNILPQMVAWGVRDGQVVLARPVFWITQDIGY